MFSYLCLESATCSSWLQNKYIPGFYENDDPIMKKRTSQHLHSISQNTMGVDGEIE